MNILVTGAAGFIGSHLVDLLILEKKHAIYGVDDLSGGFTGNINPHATFTKLDLRDTTKTAAYIQKIKPDIIFHLAADATEGRSQFTPLNSTDRNYRAYLNVLIPAIKVGFKKMILTSSMSVYGSQPTPFKENMPRMPDDIYGLAKTAMEKSTEILSNVYGFEYVIIRPHNVYGPRQNMADPYRNVLAIFINRLLQGKHFFIFGDGTQKRAFTYIDDCAPYILKSAFTPHATNEIFNIGPTEECTINQLATKILKEFFNTSTIPEKYKPEYVPMRPLEVKDAWCSVNKAKKILGYKTSVTLDEGISRMIIWAKKLGPQKFLYMDELEIEKDTTPSVWIKKLM